MGSMKGAGSIGGTGGGVSGGGTVSYKGGGRALSKQPWRACLEAAYMARLGSPTLPYGDVGAGWGVPTDGARGEPGPWD